MNWLRELLAKEILQIGHVRGTGNIADHFTKCLPTIKALEYMDVLGFSSFGGILLDCLFDFALHAGSGTRAHPEKRQSRKAAMERASRKAAKPPWNAQAAKPQSRHGTRKPQSRHGTRKPQSRKAAMERASRKAASSATHAPPPAFIAAALPPPWIAEAAKPQALRRRRRLLCSSPLCCQSVKKRQRAAKRQGVEALRSVKAAKLQEAPKRQEASKLQEAAQRRSVKEPPTKGWLCLEGDGLAYGKRSATKGWLCLEGDGLAYCETIRSEFRRTMADVMATPKRLKRSIRLNEWQFSFLFG